MKIAVVRGPSLNSWEMQNWLPLAKRHQLLFVGSRTSSVRTFEKTFGRQISKRKSNAPGLTLAFARHDHNTNSNVDIGRAPSSFSKALPSLVLVRPICIGELFGRIPLGIKMLDGLFGDPRVILGLESLVRGSDWAIGAETRSYYSLQLVRARKKGLVKKVAITCWENIPFLGDEGKSSGIKKEVRKGADLFLAVTKQARDALVAEGVSEKKIKVVPMGVDKSKFKVKSSKFKVRGKIRILSVGRLVPEKGFDDILKAMSILKAGKYKGKFELKIVGDGPEQEKLRETRIKEGLSGVVQFIKASYEEMPQIYQESDIFVLASKPTSFWKEQYGMVLAEAASCGLPIVAARSGAIPEVLENIGVYFKPGNSREIAQRLASLSDSHMRQTIASQMLFLAHKKFNAQKTANSLEGVLNAN